MSLRDDQASVGGVDIRFEERELLAQRRQWGTKGGESEAEGVWELAGWMALTGRGRELSVLLVLPEDAALHFPVGGRGPLRSTLGRIAVWVERDLWLVRQAAG